MLRVLFLACCLLCPSIACADAFGVEMGAKAEKYGIAENPSPYLYVLKNVPKPHVLFHKYAVFDSPKNGIVSLQAQTFPDFLAPCETMFDKIVKNLTIKYESENEKSVNGRDGLSQFFNHGYETNAVSIKPKKESKIDSIIVSKFKVTEKLYVIVIMYRFKNIDKWLNEYKEMWEEAF